ncbi:MULTISPECIES: hypothetical protein [unclassified Nonomuraea]|uniref:hypothetical protein n=1 Tax=unclassified Nonomuraea TaxID=2593643 RepID=UPI0033D403AD
MTKLTNYLKLSSLVNGNREMGERVAVRVWTAAGILVGALMPGATAHAGTTEGWQASYGDGRVIVLPDRSAVKVCDGRVDDRVYKAVWMNDNKIDARRPFEVRAPQGGCETDSSVLGDVWVFKLCWGHLDAKRHAVWERCGTPVWAKPRPDDVR